jgi:hypothetical protein
MANKIIEIAHGNDDPFNDVDVEIGSVL